MVVHVVVVVCYGLDILEVQSYLSMPNVEQFSLRVSLSEQGEKVRWREMAAHSLYFDQHFLKVVKYKKISIYYLLLNGK